MSEDAVAEILAAHAVTSASAAELWHRVALGQLSPDEAEARLLAERPERTAEQRQAIQRAKRVFAPLSEEALQERLDGLLARCAERSTVADGPQGVVVPMRSHRTRRWGLGLFAAAAAVVLTVWLMPPRPRWDGDPFVGGYVVELDSVAVTERGTNPRSEVPTFLLHGKVSIRLVPEEAVGGPIGVVAYVWDRTGQARRLELDPISFESGVVKLDTTVEALGLGEGEHELVIAIGWAEAMPSSWEELVEAEAVGPAGFEVVHTRLKVVARLSEGGGDE